MDKINKISKGFIVAVMFFLLCRPFAASASSKATAGINMNFNELPLSQFVKYMSKTLGENIVADPSVANTKISVISDKTVSVKEARDIMLSVFEMNNLGTIDTGGSTKVVSVDGGGVIGLEQMRSTNDEEYKREQERIALEEARERLETIKAYISSPIIPFEPQNYAGLRYGKQTEQDSRTQLAGSGQAKSVNKRKNAWQEFLHREEKSADIYSVINSGSVINAMLLTGVNSELPGNMVAQVSENVYDSPTGKRLLIPQGSRLFGTYDSKVVFGQKRPLIKWTKLIYPDGGTLDLMNMPGADRRGYAGFKAKVNNHYWPMLTNAAMVSIFAAVADYYDDNKVVINQPTINLGKNSMPVGSMILWPTEAETPDGWLACDGTDFDTSTYTDLHEVLPTGKLPNMNTDPSQKWVIKAADNISALAALLGGAAESAAAGNYNDNRSTVGRELGRTLQQMATKLLDKYLEMAPTLVVKPGYRFAVIVNKEIELPVQPVKTYACN